MLIALKNSNTCETFLQKNKTKNAECCFLYIRLGMLMHEDFSSTSGLLKCLDGLLSHKKFYLKRFITDDILGVVFKCKSFKDHVKIQMHEIS